MKGSFFKLKRGIFHQHPQNQGADGDVRCTHKCEHMAERICVLSHDKSFVGIAADISVPEILQKRGHSAAAAV